MLTDNEINKIADSFKKNIQTVEPPGDGYYYNHTSLCVIDAVWSIGVRYEGVKNVVKRYYTKRELVPHRDKNLRNLSSYPKTTQQESISDFLKYTAQFSFKELADNIFVNRQRTSTKNGILKAEAVISFAKVLSKYGVNYFQDIAAKIENNRSFEKEIKNIPGQKSGLSLDYFFMLTGDKNKIKADRMIKRFLAEPIGRNQDTINNSCAQDAFERLLLVLNDNRIKSVRHLDNIVWDYQRKKAAAYNAASRMQPRRWRYNVLGKVGPT